MFPKHCNDHVFLTSKHIQRYLETPDLTNKYVSRLKGDEEPRSANINLDTKETTVIITASFQIMLVLDLWFSATHAFKHMTCNT